MKPDHRAAQRRTYGDPCGIARALDLLGERWALLIVRELLLGPRRFGQLRRGVPAASPNVLSQRLRDLEEDGIVGKTLLEPPASVTVYELTERGQALEPILLELGRWGSATPRVRGQEMSATSMLVALKTMFAPADGGDVTYGLELGGEQFTVVIAGGQLEITRGRAAAPTTTLTCDVTTLRLVTFLGTGVRACEDAGTLTITGDRRAATRFPKYFRAPASPTAAVTSRA